jgi:hypothetical protein
MIAAEIQALYDEGTKPTHACKRDVHDQLRPIMKVGAALRRQMAVYHELLLDAQLAPHDPSLDSKLERLKNQLKPLDTLIPQFLAIGDQIGEALKQWDRIIGEDTDTLRRLVESSRPPATTATPGPAIEAGVE